MRGIDISHHQNDKGPVDLKKTRSAGYEFCLVNSTDGNKFPDPFYKENKEKTRDAGMLFGAYHFAGSLLGSGEIRLNDPIQEADFFLSKIGELKEGELAALDMEVHSKEYDIVLWSLQFLLHTEKQLGFKPLMYLGNSFLKKYDWRPISERGFALWAARYGFNIGNEPSLMFKPATGSWQNYLIWQHGSAGRVPGLVGNIDLNITDVDIHGLRKYGKPAAGSIPVPVPQPLKKWVQPIDKVHYTQLFGENPKIYAQFGLKGHNGIDYRTRFADSPLGKRYIVAVKDGVVLEIKDEGLRGYGKYIRLQHEGNEQTIYAHLHKWYVAVGQKVKQGERIALSDNTGFSTGPHLHFGWRPNGYNYNNGYKGYENPINNF